MTDKPRSFEMSIDLDASPDEVWRALTDPDELMRWFPNRAEVDPRVGGTVLWSWGEVGSWRSRIEAWEPGRRLLLVEDAERPFDFEGRLLPEGQLAPARIAMEFTLETRAGKTTLRLVHSGFGSGAAWDDEFDGISNGWAVELRGLRHYLEHHRGRDRGVARVHLTAPLSLEAAWARLTSVEAFAIEDAPLAGSPYAVTAAGHRFTGTVVVAAPGREFMGTVRELGDGILRLDVWSAAGVTGVQIWLAAYQPEAEPILRAFEADAQRLIDRLFPEAAPRAAERAAQPGAAP
ncbi:MAG TPA: SRPBCC domain-containing protein [Kofleriaceae bacterium]|nr:SRPBCC domain-containing protein [Kofleriaceae bacterium]